MVPIIKYPNPVLRKKAEPVEKIDGDILKIIDDMVDAMYGDDGAGLAAPQIGISKRIIVLDAGYGLRYIVNPEIVKKSDDLESMDEGCLSVPGIRVDIRRPVLVVVRGLDENGQEVEISADGLLARVLQHEIDHLNGILIIDYASSVQRTLLQSKLKKMEKLKK